MPPSLLRSMRSAPGTHTIHRNWMAWEYDPIGDRCILQGGQDTITYWPSGGPNAHGDTWELGPEGELRRGLLVRMLVLPEGLAGIEDNLEWIATTLAPTVTISLLAQYRPAHRVPRTPDLVDLDRGISRSEWRRAVAALEEHMEGDRHHVQGVWL